MVCRWSSSSVRRGWREWTGRTRDVFGFGLSASGSVNDPVAPATCSVLIPARATAWPGARVGPSRTDLDCCRFIRFLFIYFLFRLGFDFRVWFILSVYISACSELFEIYYSLYKFYFSELFLSGEFSLSHAHTVRLHDLSSRPSIAVCGVTINREFVFPIICGFHRVHHRGSIHCEARVRDLHLIPPL